MTYPDIPLFANPCSDCMPGPAERALAKHRSDVQNVLITLFEKPIPEADVVSREVVTRVLGKTVDWNKPVIDVANQPPSQGLGQAWSASHCVGDQGEEKFACALGPRPHHRRWTGMPAGFPRYVHQNAMIFFHIL